jgi:hypothetical protein
VQPTILKTLEKVTNPEHESTVFNIRTYFGHVATSEQLGTIWD